MSVLIIHETDFTHRVLYEYQTLPSMLKLRGHNVYVLDYESLWEKDGHLISPYKEIDIQRIYAPIHLIRPAFIKIPVLSRLSAFITHYFAIEKAIKEKKPDVIILYSVPTNGLQTVYLAHKYGIPVIFRSLDVLNQLVPPIFSGITKMLERYVYSNVDLVLAINKGLAQYTSKMGAKKVEILPLGVDKQFQPNIDATELKHKHGLHYKQVILFVGTLYKFSGLDLLIKDFHRILKEFPDARLLIVGDGTQRSKLESLIEECWLKGKVIMVGQLSYDKLPQYINLSDVCIMPFQSCETTDDIIPSKVYQYLACGKPVVSTKLKGMIEDGMGQGILFNDNVVDGIIEVLKDGEDLGSEALEYVKRHDYDNVVKQLENIMLDISRR
jgi:glycosyltransferase involved in cell wall biosynthesis